MKVNLTQDKVRLLRYTIVGIIVGMVCLSTIIHDYMDYVEPKTTDYYRNKSFKECIDKVQSNTVFVITEKQLTSCAHLAKVIYND